MSNRVKIKLRQKPRTRPATADDVKARDIAIGKARAEGFDGPDPIRVGDRIPCEMSAVERWQAERRRRRKVGR